MWLLAHNNKSLRATSPACPNEKYGGEPIVIWSRTYSSSDPVPTAQNWRKNHGKTALLRRKRQKSRSQDCRSIHELPKRHSRRPQRLLHNRSRKPSQNHEILRTHDRWSETSPTSERSRQEALVFKTDLDTLPDQGLAAKIIKHSCPIFLNFPPSHRISSATQEFNPFLARKEGCVPNFGTLVSKYPLNFALHH